MCRNRHRRTRRAAAVVELAIILPIIFLLIFGSIQACNLIFLKQSVTAAAYEGILVAVRPDATESQTEQRINAVFSARRITNGSIDITSPASSNFNDIRHGDQMSLTVTVPASENLFGPQFFVPSNNIAVTVTAYKQ